MKKIHLEAWLQKKCESPKPFTKKYRNRWFELLQGQLTYCHTPEKSEKGSIHVFAIHELLDVRRCKDKTKMELYFPERILTLRAMDEGTLLEWYYAILNSYEHFADNVQETIKNDTMLSRVAALHTEDAEPDLNLNLNLNSSESDDLGHTRAYQQSLQNNLRIQDRRESPRSLLANPKKFLSMFGTRKKSSLRNSTQDSSDQVYCSQTQSESVLEQGQTQDEEQVQKLVQQQVQNQIEERDEKQVELQGQKQADQIIEQKSQYSTSGTEEEKNRNDCLRLTDDG